MTPDRATRRKRRRIRLAIRRTSALAAAIAFFFAWGTIGAIETDAVSLVEGTVRTFGLLFIGTGFAFVGGAFRNPTERRSKHEVPSAARNPEPPCIFDGEQLSLSEEYLFRQGCFAAIRKINFRLPVALTIFAKDRRRLGQVRTTDGRSEAEGTRELCHAKKETKRDVWLAVHLSLSLT